MIDIWMWSVEQWGEERADQYLAAFDLAFAKLADHSKIGTDCGHIRQGLRRYHVGKHLLYYFDDANVIEIVRVLHERMNSDQRLDDE